MSSSIKTGSKGHSSYIAVVLAVSILVFAISGFAANISTSSGSAGQGATVTAGYSMSKVTYGGEWLVNGNSTNTNVNQFAFVLKTAADGVGTSTVTNSNTAVWAQLTTSGTNGNWVECVVTGTPVAGNTVCSPVGGQQKPLAQVTGVNVIARDRNSDPTPSFTPAELSPALWLDAADTSTITLNGSNVAQWNDKSGNGYNVSQGSGASQPAYVTNSLNGLAVVDFDGSNDGLVRNVNTDLARNASGFTVYVLQKHDTTPTTIRNSFRCLVPVIGGTRAEVSAGFTSGKGFGGGRTLDADAFRRVDTTSNVSTTNYQVQTSLYDYANTDLFVYLGATLEGSDTSFQTATTSSNTASPSLGIGTSAASTQYLDGKIAEVIAYNAAHTATQRQQVWDYLAAKWGIAL